MISTRKLEFDSLTNAVLAAFIVLYGVRSSGLHPGVLDVLLYTYLIICGLVIHFSIMAILVSLAFWLVRVQGIEGAYFGLFEVSKLPRPALRGIMEVAFVYALPAVIVTNVPASALLREDGPEPAAVWWVTLAAIGWFWLAVTIFRWGLRRYQSASS
jgi:ABC-2 type transport system permease protein